MPAPPLGSLPPIVIATASGVRVISVSVINIASGLGVSVYRSRHAGEPNGGASSDPSGPNAGPNRRSVPRSAPVRTRGVGPTGPPPSAHPGPLGSPGLEIREHEPAIGHGFRGGTPGFVPDRGCEMWHKVRRNFDCRRSVRSVDDGAESPFAARCRRFPPTRGDPPCRCSEPRSRPPKT